MFPILNPDSVEYSKMELVRTVSSVTAPKDSRVFESRSPGTHFFDFRQPKIVSMKESASKRSHEYDQVNPSWAKKISVIIDCNRGQVSLSYFPQIPVNLTMQCGLSNSKQS